MKSILMTGAAGRIGTLLRPGLAGYRPQDRSEHYAAAILEREGPPGDSPLMITPRP
jgi:hypothetical protein